MKEIEDIFGAVLELAVFPVISQLSGEAKQSIKFKVISLCDGKTFEKSERLEASNSAGVAMAHGEVRVLLKSSSCPCSFEVEAIFRGLSPGTGFSGFSMRGKVRSEDGRPSVKLTAHSNRYNVWEWSRSFRNL